MNHTTTACTYFPVLSPLPVTLNAQALALFAFLRAMAQIWGIAFGSAILTNRLVVHLPDQYVSVAAGGIEKVYALIPEIPNLRQPLKSEVQYAFGESLRPIWYAWAGISFLGLLSSLLMRDVPLHSYIDEQWMLEDRATGEKSISSERQSGDEMVDAPVTAGDHRHV
jgi:hypothetical protein